MSKSTARAVLAHKQLIIAAIAISGLFVYLFPTTDAIAQLFTLRTNGVSVDVGEYGFVSVRTDRVSVDTDQERVRVLTSGLDLTIQRTGFQWWNFVR